MISAKQFYNDYLSLVTNEYWDVYHDNKQWTSCVTKIIKEIIKKYSLTPQTEYFRVDVTGWISHWEDIKEEAQAVKLNPHLWDLEIAVEHENDNSDWTDELVKLVHIKCPLKVIIGYTPCDMRYKELERLQFAGKLLYKVKAFNRCPNEEYLIILGNSAPKESKNHDYSNYDYRGYIYSHSKNQFEEILEKKKV